MLSTILFYIDPNANSRRSFEAHIVCVYDDEIKKKLESITSEDFFKDLSFYRNILSVVTIDFTPGQKEEKYKVEHKRSDLQILAVFIFFDLHQSSYGTRKKIMCTLNKLENTVHVSPNGAYITE